MRTTEDSEGLIPPSIKKRSGSLYSMSSMNSSSSPNADGRRYAPRLQQLHRHFRGPLGKRRLLFYTSMVVGLVQLAVKIVTLGLFCGLEYDEAPSYFVSWIVFSGINIVLLVLGLTGRLVENIRQDRKLNALVKLKPEKNIKDMIDKISSLSGTWQRAIFLFNMSTATFIVISGTVYLANTASFILTLPVYSSSAAVLVGFECVDCAISVGYLILVVLRECLPFAMVAQAFTVVLSVLNLLIAILTIWANEGSRIITNARIDFDDSPSLNFEYLLKRIRVYPYVACIVAFSSGVGVCTGLSVDATNRLSDIGSTVSAVYILTCTIAFVICTVYLGLSARNVHYYLNETDYLRDVLIADPIISSVGIILSLCGIAAMLKVRQWPYTDLQVEEYDLSKLSPEQLEVWARLIDVYNKTETSNPDAAAGHEAISLLKAYAGSSMPSMNCRVLRVYDAGQKAYEKIRAWDRLDQNEVFGNEEPAIDQKASVVNWSADSICGGSKGNENGDGAAAAGGLSKNAAKRAKMKAAKKAAKKGGDVAAAEAVHEQLQASPEEIKRDTQFRNDLIATEALILLTCIENYDLLGPVSNTWYGRFASRLFGPNTPFKMSCIRMGLLATHWPFRQAMLFTSFTRKPNARAAAVCRAVADYNKKLHRSERCTMILNPTVAHRGVEKAIRPSGWTSVKLPPSHVVDLRPYANCTIQQYLKKIKYRDQAKTFQKAKGKVIETTDFNDENCKTTIRLWWNIASKRVADGNTSVLANPTPEFLKSLGSINNEKGYRSLLFLKVDGKIIASAVLFRLGYTITSDIQGLDHEFARKYNAYFVMMQETISIALKSGLKFVDFGPTTSEPKMAIGCKEVSIYGGIYACAPLSWFISIFSDNVHVDE